MSQSLNFFLEKKVQKNPANALVNALTKESVDRIFYQCQEDRQMMSHKTKDGKSNAAAEAGVSRMFSVKEDPNGKLWINHFMFTIKYFVLFEK